jgi:hypothetical protein
VEESPIDRFLQVQAIDRRRVVNKNVERAELGLRGGDSRFNIGLDASVHGNEAGTATIVG